MRRDRQGAPAIPMLWALASPPRQGTGSSSASRAGKEIRQGGIPTHGIMGIFIKDSDQFAHGLNERVSVRAFYDGLEVWYTVLQEVGG